MTRRNKAHCRRGVVLRRVRRGYQWCAYAIAILTLHAAQAAQEPADDPPRHDGESLEALRVRADSGDVYLNDSFEAADALAEATGFERRGRWDEAAKVLLRAIETAGDKLVRVSRGGYVGISKYVNERIARWPPPGIAAYRRLAEPELKTTLDLLGDSRDVNDLIPLFDRYFCTLTAAQLADKIGQLAIEAGDLALADYVYARTLEHHPSAATVAPRYRIMRTLIAAMRGERSADAPGADLAQKIRWMGQEQTLESVIAQIGDGFAPITGRADENDWPIFGGSNARDRRAGPTVNEPGLLWRFQIADSDDGEPRDTAVEIISGSDRDAARQLTMYPVVSGGLIFLQAFREIIALHRNTGVVAWRFRADPHRVEPDNYLDDQPPGWHSVTVEGGRVYASLPGEDVSYYNYEPTRRGAEVLCLDARSGRVVWRVGDQSSDVRMAEVHFDSAPIVRNGRLYIVGRRRRSFGFEDCYLYRFNAADGSVEQRVHLGSASTAAFGSRTATAAIAALKDDTVYVGSGLGSVAAVSAYTGVVRWLRLYERARDDGSGARGRSTRDVTPWQFNPIVALGDRIVCLPTDSANVLVLSADDGRTLKTIPVARLGALDAILGVRGDLLCGTGREAVCYDLAKNVVRWATRIGGESGVFGRGVWAGETLLVPTRKGLSSFDVSDGSRTDASWNGSAEGGNLLALPDQLLVAGRGSIAAYVRKAQIWDALRVRMAEAPDDPLPALEFAEVKLGAGEYAEALSVFEEAVDRMDRLTVPPDTALGQRLFVDVLKFASVLSHRADLEVKTLDKLYAWAAPHASDASSNVRYRFLFASLFDRSGQPDRALRLYHQVLRDRSLRELSAVDGDVSTPTAGEQANSRIASLIRVHGRAIYRTYEAQAGRWLRGARAVGSDEAFERLVQTFPNSEAAPLALRAYGDWLVDLNRVVDAARQYTRAYHAYPKRVDRPALMRKIADTFVLANRPEHAYRWLTKAAHDYPSAVVEHEGRSLTFLQYRDRLAGVADRVEPSRPHIELPLSKSASKDFGEAATLLAPRFGQEPTNRWSRYYVSTKAGIRSIEPRTGKEVWAKPATKAAEVELLIARSDVVVFATEYEVFAVDAATGERRWSHGKYPRHLQDPGADWEDGGALRSHALYGDRLVSGRDTGELICIALDTGRVVWSQTYRPVAAGPIRLVDPWVVYHAIQGGRIVLAVVDAAEGEWLGSIATQQERALEDLFVTLDGQILLVTSQTISSYDTSTLSLRWNVPLSGTVRQPSLLTDLEAIYFSDNGSEIEKLHLQDGRRLWRSERLVSRGGDELLVGRQDNSLIVSTASSVAAVDADTGLTLWRGTAPDRPRFVGHFLTKAYVIAVDANGEMHDGQSVVYFYDHRNASGLIPRVGGALKLGQFEQIQAVLVVDGALLLQSGSTIHVYTNEQNNP